MRGRGGATGAVVALVGAVLPAVLAVLAGLTGCTGRAGASGPSGAPGPSGPSGAPGPSGGGFRNDGEYGAPVRIPSAPGLPGWSHSLGFAPDGSGFALLADCVTADGSPELGFCRQHVAVRDAGAEEWVVRRSPLPRVTAPDGVSAHLRALGPGRALIEDGGGDRPERAWFTRDGGRGWRAVDRRPAGRVPAIPAGAVLTTFCAAPVGAGPDTCVRERLAVISPEDGRRHELVAAPPLGAHPVPAEQPEPDGSWWVSGTDPRSGRAAVAVSRDAGRSWTVTPLPSPTGAPVRYAVVAVGRDAVYAAEMGELTGGEPVKNPLRALHRSLDGGRTWQRTWTTGEVREPRSLLGMPVPGPGGRVEIGAERGGRVSLDGGRTFTGPGGSHHTRRTPVGLLRETSSCTYALTSDGVRWSEFRLACGGDETP